MDTELSLRLQLVAELVGVCDTVADVGTDHALLPISLIESGKAKRVYATDVHRGPLERARVNIEAHLGKEDGRIQTVLCDGLDGLDEPCDVTVIAGMGGTTIMQILSRVKPYDGQVFVLQTMTSPEELRAYLYENGFRIEEEKAVEDEGFFYTVMRVSYEKEPFFDDLDTYFSKPMQARMNETDRAYLDRVLAKLDIKINGMKKAKKPLSYEKELDMTKRLRGIKDASNRG